MIQKLRSYGVPPLADIEETPIDLPSEDGIPLDSSWHARQIYLLISVVETAWAGRRFYCQGNNFLHHSKVRARNRDFSGPDFYVVKDVEHDRLRDYWCSWEEEGRNPSFIVELLSPSTAKKDRTVKKAIYEREVKAAEYFLYDPDTEQLIGYRLGKTRYAKIPVRNGQIWSDEMQMFLGTWVGAWDQANSTWLRFFDVDGTPMPTAAESERKLRIAADERAIAADERAEIEAAKVREATERTGAAEARIRELEEELRKLRGNPNAPA